MSSPRTTRTRLLLYGVLPLLLVGGMVIGYHSPLRALVAPDSGKEFGLLENLQNVLLIGIAAVGIAGFRRKKRQWERICLIFVVAGALFMLLEETDYGFQYVGGRPVNIHEVGSIEATLEHIARFGGLIFFGGFAILFADSKNAVLRYLAPDRYAVLTILLVTACWEIAIRLPASEGALAGHEIEYAELGIYYLVLVYMWDVVFWRRYD
jgi:hypothetical protein